MVMIRQKLIWFPNGSEELISGENSMEAAGMEADSWKAKRAGAGRKAGA